MPISDNTVLVTFDMKDATSAHYDQMYEILKTYGLKPQVFKADGTELKLPTTTVIGTLRLGESSNERTVHRDLFEKFKASNLPVTRLLVAFVNVLKLYA